MMFCFVLCASILCASSFRSARSWPSASSRFTAIRIVMLGCVIVYCEHLLVCLIA